jgi:hypothetical protein
MVQASKNIRLSCCEVCYQLAEQFAINARLYSEAVVLLTRDPAMAGTEYEELREAAIQAQTRAEAAGIRFEEHVDTHRCGRTTTDAPDRFAAGILGFTNR